MNCREADAELEEVLSSVDGSSSNHPRRTWSESSRATLHHIYKSEGLMTAKQVRQLLAEDEELAAMLEEDTPDCTLNKRIKKIVDKFREFKRAESN